MAPRYAEAAGGAPPAPDVLAMAWILALPAEPLVIVGTNKLDRARAAAAAVSIRLEREDWYALWQAAQGRGVP
jgi:predicted oxidoreductase